MGKALDAITKEQSVGSYVSADCGAHINEQDCLVHGCEYRDDHCQMTSSAKEVAVGSLGCDSDSDCATGEKCIHDWFMGDVCQIQTAREQAVGADPCDEYCEDWEDFKKGKLDKEETADEICGYYKSERCKTCAVVQSYCGWKKITEAEEYSYTTVPGGKCRTLAGADPKFLWKEDKGPECEKLCNEKNDCFGYSYSEFDHCLLWLQRDIMGGGDEWGGAACHIKDIQCEGNVGYDYNCWECFGNGKYLWGNTCLAKELGKNSYVKGQCGLEYKCFTDGESIGECPYETYCPSV